MRFRAAALIWVIAAAFLLPCTVVSAEPAFVPHEDPFAAQSVMDSYSFLSEYADVLSLAASEQYANASSLAEQLSHITVPEDLSYVINRYNNITQELIGVLADLKNTLDSASSLLNQNRLGEASQALDHAGVLVARAQILLGDLQDATTTLSQRLGVFAAPAESKIRQVYDTLQGLLQRLNELIDRYHALLQSIDKQAEDIRAKDLKPTQLTLNLNPSNVIVGGAVTASGALSTGAQILPNRIVQLFLDGTQVATANTDSNGNYHAVLNIPYRYVHAMAAQALYTPLSGDKEVYLGALSPTVSINVMFYDTKLNVIAPDVAYPGLAYTVSGTVTSQDGTPLNQREVRVLFDGVAVGEVKTDSSGLFSIQSTVSAQTKTGAHILTVAVDPEGIYAGTSQRRTLTVAKIASTVSVHAPSFVFLPAGVQISGIVGSVSGPLNNAKVTLEFANISTVVRTLEDGTFNSTMNIPLSTVFAGSQNVEVTVEPAEPWQALAQTKVSVFVLNSISIAFTGVASFSIVVVLYARFVSSKPKKSERKIEVPDDNSALPLNTGIVGATVSVKAEFRFEGVKGKVLEAYVKALRSVESVTGSVLSANMTLREFLYEAEPKLGNAVSSFTELTVLAERTLYSPHVPEAQDVAKAEEYANEIGRMLNR